MCLKCRATAVDRQSQAYEAALTQIDCATQLVRGHQLVMVEAQILFERGNLLADCGDRTAAIAAFDESLRLARLSNNPVADEFCCSCYAIPNFAFSASVSPSRVLSIGSLGCSRNQGEISVQRRP